LGLYAIHFTNSLSHLGVALGSGTYNPGALSAALILLPLSVGGICLLYSRQHAPARNGGPHPCGDIA
jgi:hypothetical protein